MALLADDDFRGLEAHGGAPWGDALAQVFQGMAPIPCLEGAGDGRAAGVWVGVVWGVEGEGAVVEGDLGTTKPLGRVDGQREGAAQVGEGVAGGEGDGRGGVGVAAVVFKDPFGVAEDEAFYVAEGLVLRGGDDDAVAGMECDVEGFSAAFAPDKEVANGGAVVLDGALLSWHEWGILQRMRG